MKINSNSTFTFNLSQIKKAEPEQTPEAAIAKEEPAKISTVGHQFSQTIDMSSHFFDKQKEDSKYTAALLDSLKIDEKFKNNMASLINSGGGGDNYAERVLEGQKAARAAEDEAKRYATEKTEKQLDDDRKEREEDQDKKIEKKLSPDTYKIKHDSDPEEAIAEMKPENPADPQNQDISETDSSGQTDKEKHLDSYI
jgi:hypothetical protein